MFTAEDLENAEIRGKEKEKRKAAQNAARQARLSKSLEIDMTDNEDNAGSASSKKRKRQK